ncbi:SusC/RagA family TonB-linked outer membrane protein [Segetibacter koreensis]|uniref:SusC/RagA family TonB-linked outer membrane protein n=1 Tax=Segetibacter koreensis TaxID=398037 RepID=UPI00037D6D0A|nr:SusC/RagA family TonB-linked outer membrane protein [Segetibacter koreensis]
MFKHYKLLTGLLAFLFYNSIYAQNVTVNGSVVSKSDNKLLAGVSVLVEGSSKGTKTDNDGHFTLTSPVNSVATFSFIGYQAQKVTLNSSTTTLNIALENAENSLNEVVVTALGITKQKKSLGYAVQELKSKDFSEAKEPNLVNALEGKIAGVRITNSQGDMGSSRIVIRGETSISGNNQPLFVVDGVPVDNSQLGAGGSRDYANAISDLSAEDIETISVLKGPNAAALYGSRAAHGVVLIKTKTGKRQKGLGITLNSNTTFSNLLILPKYQNVFGQGANGQFSYVDGKGGGVNDGVDESWGPKLDGTLIPQFNSNGQPVPFIAHPNNVKDYFRTGVTLNNGVAIANAGDKFDYRVSYNNSNQKGVIPNSELNKHSVSLNTTFKVDPKLTLTAAANYFIDDAPNLPGSGGKRATSTMLQFTWFGRQVDMNQLRNYRDANGNTFNWNNSYYSNPFFVAYENTVQQRRDRIIGNLGLNYKITDDLTANFRSGSDYYTDRRKLKVAYGTSGTPFGSYEEDAYTVNENNTEGTLSYNKKVSSDFSVDVLAGGNIRTKTYSENIQQAPRLAVAGVYTLSNSRDPLVSSNYFSKLKQYSLFSSAQVGFRNYAFLNLTARNDWSSTLPIENLSYFYPSINGSLVLTDAFDIKSNVLSFAKIRGGWSKVGSDADPYQLVNTYNFNAPFNSNPQLTATGKDLNPNLKSESTTSTEIGAEAAFFNNRARLDVSLYNTNSYNQILFVDVSATTGYTSKLLNAGKINNKGIEVQLGVTPVKTNAFSWDVNVNYGSNRSKVIELDKEGRLQNYVLGSYRNIQVLAAVGQPYGTLYGNAFLRDASGNIIVNADGLPATDPNKKVLGKYTPDWTGGITNSFSYKGITASVLIDASYGGSIFAGTNSTGSYTGVLESTLPGRDAAHGGLLYYYPGNDKANGTVQLTNGTAAPAGETVYDDGMIYKGVTADGKANSKIIPASSYYKSTRNIEEAYVYNASFVKLREVRLSYALPSRWISRIGFAGASVSLVGRNLLFIHKNVPNIDPETAFNNGNAQGLEDLTLPTTRSYGFNINLKF